MKQISITLLLLLSLSTNIFAQWMVQRTATSGENFHSIYFVNHSYGWTIDNHAFFWTTNGGEVWNKNTLTDGIWKSIYFLNDSIGFIGGYEIWKTTDSGSSWITVKNLPSIATVFSFDFLDDNKGFAVGGQDNFYLATFLKTTDGGNTWNEVSTPIVDCFYSISAFKISPTSSKIVIVGLGDKVLTSYDEGNSWSIKQINSSYNYDVQFISADIGWISSYPKIFRTTNGGENWITSYVDPSHVGDLTTVFFVDSMKGWTANYNAIYMSEDGGITWEEQSTPLTNINSIYFVDTDMGWACGSEGILFTQNGGIPVELVSFTAESVEGNVILKWKTATELNNLGFEIERKIINVKEYQWKRIAFKEGYGTTTETQSYEYCDDISELQVSSLKYRLKQIDFDGSYEYSNEVFVEILVPVDYALQQNYPNPFNPTTNITYSIPRISLVTIKIYDVLGNEIATLVNEEKPVGNYEVEFDASELTSGVYFYAMTAGGKINIRKMVLLK